MPGLNFLQGLNAVQIGAITGFVSGGVATGSLRGALTGAISGAAFGSLHNWKSNLIAKGIDYGRIAAHGMVGGISSVLSGGKFGHGFAAAGFTQAASEIGGDKLFIEGAESFPDRAANAIKAAVIGGSASVLSGGKFGNGAITGAFSRLLNDDSTVGQQETGCEDSCYPEGREFSEHLESSMPDELADIMNTADKMAYYRASGQFGEDAARTEYLNRGYEVWDGPISVIAGGGLRYPDLAIKAPGSNTWEFVEVKTGASPLIKRQIIRDRAIQRTGFYGISGPLRFEQPPTNVRLYRITFQGK